MINVSSRLLAVLMLAVLAFTDVTTTSAFAAGFLRIRPPRFVDVPWGVHRPPEGVINRGGVLENSGWDSWSQETCTFACEPKRSPGRVDSPW